MTEPLFFDSDCISAFLWVNEQSILSQLYPGRIIIPRQSYRELSNPSIPHLKQRVDTLVSGGNATIQDMDIGSKEYRLYIKMTNSPDEGHKIIGDGEAAAIALAKENNGILASNNMRDIKQYVSEYKIEHVTTGDILMEAMNRGFITEAQGNTIWASMIAKRRKLGASTFTEYISKK